MIIEWYSLPSHLMDYGVIYNVPTARSKLPSGRYIDQVVFGADEPSVQFVQDMVP